ncbi:MAG TPA: DUF2760 domain-containing protein [Burkholderiales bacterium]|nr:DUF2760 domain-containing protein [Burkholderiales bacterium]
MGILIAAVAALLLSTLQLVPIPSETLPANFWPYRDVALVILTAFIAVQSLIVLRSRKNVAPRAVEPPRPEPPKPTRAEQSQTGEALILLSLLQEKGRFLDYLMEDITAFNDAQVAAASRVVHQGCGAVIKECLALSPAHSGKEGERITIEKSADPNHYRLLGKVPGAPPYSGVVVHRGWKTTKIALPRFTRSVDPVGANIVSPVEVEVR